MILYDTLMHCQETLATFLCIEIIRKNKNGSQKNTGSSDSLNLCFLKT